MDEDEFECDVEIEVVEAYAPLAWSWRVFIHNALTATSAAIGVGAEFIDSVATQVGCSSAKARADAEKADAVAEARRMLSALDQL